MPNLERFIDRQQYFYPRALKDLKRGRKTTHRMWRIFPQLKGLGQSEKSEYYGILDLEEAKQYLAHPILSSRLVEVSEVLLWLENTTAEKIFWTIDSMKLRSCMTLFSIASEGIDTVFDKVLEKYFDGKRDEKTIVMLEDKIGREYG